MVGTVCLNTELLPIVMVKYVGISAYQYVARSHVSTFLRTELTTWLGYPLSHGFTGFIESTTSRMSSRSNRNADNTRSVTPADIFFTDRRYH